MFPIQYRKGNSIPPAPPDPRLPRSPTGQLQSPTSRRSCSCKPSTRGTGRTLAKSLLGMPPSHPIPAQITPPAPCLRGATRVPQKCAFSLRCEGKDNQIEITKRKITETIETITGGRGLKSIKTRTNSLIEHVWPICFWHRMYRKYVQYFLPIWCIWSKKVRELCPSGGRNSSSKSRFSMG